MFVKVSDMNEKEKGVDGYSASVVKLAIAPKDGNCSANGSPRFGPEDADTTNVEVISVDPVPSVAVKVMITGPTSPAPGTPDNVLLALSSCSQPGGFLST